MKQADLMNMYGTVPESFTRCIASALKKTEKEPVKRLRSSTAAIALASLLLLMATGFAAFHSQVLEFFGSFYGDKMAATLEGGDIAIGSQTFILGDAVFTLEEILYGQEGFYGVGTIRPREGSDVLLLAEDFSPQDPYGYDTYGAGGRVETAPEGPLTAAEIAKKEGKRMMVVRVLPEYVMAEGKYLQSCGSFGYTIVPRRDGSLRFSFELPGSYGIEEGNVYTVVMYASCYEVDSAGEPLNETWKSDQWQAEMVPVKKGE